jgi:hypothetical protein
MFGVFRKFWSVGAVAMCLAISFAASSRACQQGFVWREALPNDHVCVTPTERTIAAQQNSNPWYTCPRGYVWREAIRGVDKRCVTAEERKMTWDENAKAAERGDRVSPRRGPSPPPKEAVPYGNDLELNPVKP